MAFLTLISFLAMDSVDAQQPSFVPGQVLMRFSEGTPQRETVAQVSQTVPLDLSGLDNVTDELSARAGVPLRLHHLGSGYWLTFDVDRSRLSTHVQGILQTHEDVQGVVVTPAADSTVRYRIEAKSGSRLRRAIERRNQRGLQDLTAEWSTAVGLRLEFTVENDHLAIWVDWNAATLELVDRINAMQDVEAAQPNYRMGVRLSQ